MKPDIPFSQLRRIILAVSILVMSTFTLALFYNVRMDEAARIWMMILGAFSVIGLVYLIARKNI